MKQGAILAGLSSILWAGLVAPASAATSTFEGTIFAPERGGDTIVVRGDLDFDPSVCPPTRGDMELWGTYWGTSVSAGLFPESGVSPGEASWYNLRGPDGGWTPPEGAHYFEGTYTGISPGTYIFVVAGFYGPITGDPDLDDGQWLVCQTLSPERVSIVEITSVALETRSSSLEINQGESVTVGLDQVKLWSDGVVTRNPAPESDDFRYTLQGREIGTFDWVRLASDWISEFRVTPTMSTEYRILAGTQLSKPVSVDVNRPTLARRIQEAQVTPASAIAGSTLRLSAFMETQYTDGTWKPSPPGTDFQVQFRADGSPVWEDVTDRRVVGRIQVAGEVRVELPMIQDGAFRFLANGAVSETMQVVTIIPTSVVAIDSLSLPMRAKRQSRLRFKVAVETKYSDGMYRPSPEGTLFSIEFAPKNRSRSLLDTASMPRDRWSVVKSGQVIDRGVIRASLRASKTGYWRVRVGDQVTGAELVRVRR